MLDYSPSTRVLIIISAAVIIVTTLYGGANLVCKSSLRSCSYGNACPTGSICVDYGGGIQKCSANYCATFKKNAAPAEQAFLRMKSQVFLYVQQISAKIGGMTIR